MNLIERVKHLANLFVGGDACGHEGKPQFVFDKAHGVEQTFHSCGVAVDKEQAEKLGELMVDCACALIVAFECESHHFGEFLWEGVAYYGNHSDGSEGDKGESDAVVAGDNAEVGVFVFDDVVHLADIA